MCLIAHKLISVKPGLMRNNTGQFNTSFNDLDLHSRLQNYEKPKTSLIIVLQSVPVTAVSFTKLTKILGGLNLQLIAVKCNKTVVQGRLPYFNDLIGRG